MTAVPAALAVCTATLVAVGVLLDPYPSPEPLTTLAERTGGPAASTAVAAASDAGPCARGALSVLPARAMPLDPWSARVQGPADGQIAFATIEVDPSSEDGYGERRIVSFVDGSIVMVGGVPREQAVGGRRLNLERLPDRLD